MNEIPEYVSDDESGTIDKPVKKKHRVCRNWVLDQVFRSAEDAKNFITDLNIWTIDGQKNTLEGHKVTYRCNRVPFKNRGQCPSGIYLLYHSTDLKVSLFKTDADHANHEVVARGLSEDMRRTIQQIFDEGTTRATSILATLKLRGITAPPKSQLCNFLSVYRKNKYGQCTISVSELKQWCDNRKSIPKDPDQPFVVDLNVSAELGADHPQLQIFMSTTRLLEQVAFI